MNVDQRSVMIDLHIYYVMNNRSSVKDVMLYDQISQSIIIDVQCASN